MCNKTTNQKRFEQLNTILQYCTETGRYFTTGERICINQERADLLNYEHDEDFIVKPAPTYTHSPELTNKIANAINIVKNNCWHPRNPIKMNNYD